MKIIYFFLVQLCLLFSISPGLSAQIHTASFTTNSRTVCVGQSVQFFDLSTNTPTSWAWNFTGGNPSYSALQNPVVIYTVTGKYSVHLTAYNDQESVSMGQYNMISVTECTGISEDAGESGWSIFPNPARSYINVLATSDAPYVLHDALGSVLVGGRIKKEEINKIDLDNFPGGIYFLNVRLGLGTKSYKVIKE